MYYYVRHINNKVELFYFYLSHTLFQKRESLFWISLWIHGDAYCIIRRAS